MRCGIDEDIAERAAGPANAYCPDLPSHGRMVGPRICTEDSGCAVSTPVALECAGKSSTKSVVAADLSGVNVLKRLRNVRDWAKHTEGRLGQARLRPRATPDDPTPTHPSR